MAKYRKEIGDLILSDHDCPKSAVLAAITGSASFAILHDEWRSIAIHLELAEYKIKELADEFMLKVRIKTLPQLVDEVLAIWKAEKGDQAKVANLCCAFEKCGLTDIAEALSKALGKVKHSKDVQKYIWHGKLVTVDELLPKVWSERSSEDDIKTKEVYPTQDTPIIRLELNPPAPPNYYVPRTLFYFPSHEVDPAIFTAQLAEDNVFLLKDISKSEFAKLTQYKYPIELSGDQLHDEVSAKLILLEIDEDFDTICSKNTKKNVHMIQRNDDQFFWLKSNKNLDLIQKYLKEPTIDISEEDLAARIVSLPAPCSFSIADSPGMGKTLVLANLATKIQESSSTDTIHLFIVLQEFFEQIKRIDSTSSAFETIAAYSSSNGVTTALLSQMMKNAHYQVYLYLDGYDEVLQNKFELVDEFLKYIQQIQNFKIIVTTRPHMKRRLEVIFNQFSYEIHPFTEPNQIDFLTRYWVDQHGTERSIVLEQFARQCVSAFHTSTSDGEREIAGIPLQCMMMGEVYAEDAKRASHLKELHPGLVKPITFFQMYKRLIEKTFSRITEGSSAQNYRNAHVHLAIQLLFPEWIEVFKPILGGHDDVDDTTIYSIGLVEQSPTATPRFLHRTFAEYLLAEFIVANLGKNLQCVEFLIGEIMRRNETIMKHIWFKPNGVCYGYVKYKMIFPAIGYFIDFHLKESSTNALPLPNCLETTKLEVEDVCVAINVCCFHDLENSFNFVTQLLLHHGFCIGAELRDKYFQHLPLVTVRRCKNIRILEGLLEFTKQFFGVDMSYHVLSSNHTLIDIPNYTPLHEAVNRGDYNIASWLVKQYGDQVHNLKCLLHACVNLSVFESDSVVTDKMLITDMLVSIQRSWLNERDKDECTPLLEVGVNLELLQHLVDKGADINAYSREKGTILHQYRETENEYMELVRWALSNGFKLINHTDNIFGRTPLMYAIYLYGTLEDEMLEVLLEAGANVNAEDKYGNSVLFHALEHSGNVDLVKNLVERNADVKHKNCRNQNPLHMIMLAKYVPTETKQATLDWLIEINRDWTNENDEDGCTPLLVYCNGQNRSSYDLRMLQRLVEHGADISAYSSKYGTVLHSYCDKENYTNLVRWAFSSGFNLVDRKDRHNQTPLMHAMKCFGTLDEEVLQLFQEARAEMTGGKN